MTPEQIREAVDARHPRVRPDWSINTQHVAEEQTLRTRHGHPGYIDALDGPGNFRPTVRADELTAEHVGLFLRSGASTIGVLLEVGGGPVWDLLGEPAPSWPGAVRLACGLDAEVFRVTLVAHAALTVHP